MEADESIISHLAAHGAANFSKLLYNVPALFNALKNPNLSMVLAPNDDALEKLSTASGKFLADIERDAYGIDILANHISTTATRQNFPMIISINGNQYGSTEVDIRSLEPAALTRIGKVSVLVIGKIIIYPGQLEKASIKRDQTLDRFKNGSILYKFVTHNRPITSLYGNYSKDKIEAIAIGLNYVKSSNITNGRLIRISFLRDIDIIQNIPDRPEDSPGLYKTVDEKSSMGVFLVDDEKFPFMTEIIDVQYIDFRNVQITSSSTYDQIVYAVRRNLENNYDVPVLLISLSPSEALLDYAVRIDELFREVEVISNVIRISQKDALAQVFSRTFGFRIGNAPQLVNSEPLYGGQSADVSYGMLNGRLVVRKEQDWDLLLREAIMMKYVNMTKPNHTAELYDFYFGDDRNSAFIIMEYIPSITAWKLGDLDINIFIAYWREIFYMLIEDIKIGIYSRDINRGNILLVTPLDVNNPVVRRIDYGEQTCFHLPEVNMHYTCDRSRQELYTKADEYLSFINDMIRQRNQRLPNVQEKELLKTFADELRKFVDCKIQGMCKML